RRCRATCLPTACISVTARWIGPSMPFAVSSERRRSSAAAGWSNQRTARKVIEAGPASPLWTPAGSLLDGLDGESAGQVPLGIEVAPIVEVPDGHRHFRAEFQRAQVARIVGQLPVHLLPFEAGDSDPDELRIARMADRRLDAKVLTGLGFVGG